MHIPRQILFILVIPLVLSSAVPVTTVQKAVEEICTQIPLASGQVGVLAVSSEGDTLVNFNGARCMVPASNMKLLTCGVALDALGFDFRFETTLACSGEISGGTLTGNLYIIGGCDPTTAAEKTDVEALFAEWKSFLDAAGICRINGAVIADGSCLCVGPEYDSWCVYDCTMPYGAVVSGLNFFENSQIFRLYAPREDGQLVDFSVVYPETPWMEFRSSAVTSSGEDATGVNYSNTPMTHSGEFTGTCRAGNGNFEMTVSNCFPELTCAYHFYRYLNDNGISTAEYFSASSRGVNLRKLGTSVSVPLKDIVAKTLKLSDNLYAEAILQALLQKVGKQGLQAWLSLHGIETQGCLYAVDGSGLSRNNYASPSFFVRFLLAMMGSKEYDSFVEGLPRPGEATLKKCLPHADEQLRSRIAMKSGSMTDVLCFSGYIFPKHDAPDDRTLAFSVMTNNVTGGISVIRPIIDRILTALAEEQ